VHDRRARTTSPDTTVREFYFFMSALTFNIWVLLNLKISPIRGFAEPIVSLVRVIGTLSKHYVTLDMG
jgi:IS4 transposase